MSAPTTDAPDASPGRARARAELFLVSLLVLFLELACIRWLPAHVLYLTFFTNTVLLASFLGMSLGCIAAGRSAPLILATPALLALTLALGVGISSKHDDLAPRLDVGGNAETPQVVFYATEATDIARFVVPIELVAGLFFLLCALAMAGPGQELGRALARVPDRIEAYTINVAGSIVGILLFVAISWLQLPPVFWFALVAALVAWLAARVPRSRAARALALAPLVAVLVLSTASSGAITREGRTTGEHRWSPYYRVDHWDRSIAVNLIGHQRMMSRTDHEPYAHVYSLPYLLRRDVGGGPVDDVLVVGAGSGNDVSFALGFGAGHVDAVEIDPAIARIGAENHPDRPYQDPRVELHVDDGRHFLRSTDRRYDVVVFALVDSLVLHSSTSGLRLESYLYTRQSFEDVRRHLKPGGVFVAYNFFRQGWIVARLEQTLREVFEKKPIVISFSGNDRIEPDTRGGFTILMAGATDPLEAAFARGQYFMTGDPGPASGNGFAPDMRVPRRWFTVRPATVTAPPGLASPTDDWPFLYLRDRTIPELSLRGMAIMLGIAVLLFALLRERGRLEVDGRMFFLGAAFMLVETSAVVRLSLVFGGTWLVNSAVFLTVLLMILAANVFVRRARPERLWPFYAILIASLIAGAATPLDAFFGLPRAVEVALACAIVLAPVLFAAVIFAVAFSRSERPDVDFGVNVGGAMLGGLSEYASTLLGYRRLALVAAAFYALSAILARRRRS